MHHAKQLELRAKARAALLLQSMWPIWRQLMHGPMHRCGYPGAGRRTFNTKVQRHQGGQSTGAQYWHIAALWPCFPINLGCSSVQKIWFDVDLGSAKFNLCYNVATPPELPRIVLIGGNHNLKRLSQLSPCTRSFVPQPVCSRLHDRPTLSHSLTSNKVLLHLYSSLISSPVSFRFH